MRADRRRAGIVPLLALALPSFAANPPAAMMANVYRLTEAAAVLDICAHSPLHRKLSNDKALHLQGLVTRLGTLVRNIGKHYKDDGLYITFENTKAKIASEAGMQSYSRSKYEYCGDRLFADMDAYVAENEKLINGYLQGQSPAAKK